jgi:hypothetical protein
MPVRRLAIQFRSFPQSLQANTEVMPQLENKKANSDSTNCSIYSYINHTIIQAVYLDTDSIVK